MHSFDRSLRTFHNQMAILRSLDKNEISHPKIDEWWEVFCAEPYEFFLRCDDSRQRAIWSAMLYRGA